MNEVAIFYRYIVRTEGVRAGNARVENTRIGVHDVVALVVNGATVDDVVRTFPDLTRAQIYECLAYYEDHRGEIDTLVARQMSPPAALLAVVGEAEHDIEQGRVVTNEQMKARIGEWTGN
jgi:uncharacterized protein (DUF433 family)